VDAPFAPIAPPPDPNAASDIAQQVREADNAEREVTGSGQSVQPTQPARLGETKDQVMARLGRPTEAVALGNGIVYSYEPPSVPYPVKIYFSKEGKVTDVQ